MNTTAGNGAAKKIIGLRKNEKDEFWEEAHEPSPILPSF
jgi:hypothetical protein